MKLQRISRNNAYSHGADLWIIPSKSTSHWAKEMDWYLNFQIAKSKKHESRGIDLELMNIINKENLGITNKKLNADAPLMIASHNLLPNKQTVCIDKAKDAEHWLSIAFKVWKTLKHPSLRLFLPPDLKYESLLKLWPQKETKKQVTIVDDLYHEKTN